MFKIKIYKLLNLFREQEYRQAAIESEIVASDKKTDFFLTMPCLTLTSIIIKDTIKYGYKQK